MPQVWHIVQGVCLVIHYSCENSQPTMHSRTSSLEPAVIVFQPSSSCSKNLSEQSAADIRSTTNTHPEPQRSTADTPFGAPTWFGFLISVKSCVQFKLYKWGPAVVVMIHGWQGRGAQGWCQRGHLFGKRFNWNNWKTAFFLDCTIFKSTFLIVSVVDPVHTLFASFE